MIDKSNLSNFANIDQSLSKRYIFITWKGIAGGMAVRDNNRMSTPTQCLFVHIPCIRLQEIPSAASNF